MKTLISTSTSVRFGLAASVLGMAISWPNEANAEVADPPPHRVEFTVSPGLPKCNDYDAFYSILVNWVRVRSIDPTAKRKLVVAIKRQLDGQKRVDLSVLDPEGGEIAAESHGYSATEECFKVLYWTAWDSAKLLRTTISPPVEEPPMSVDKLVEEAEKAVPVQENRPYPPKNWPGLDPDVEHSPRQCEGQGPREEARPARHIVVGLGATVGLTWMPLPGLRVGLGRAVGPMRFELDARLFPPVITYEWDAGIGQQIFARAQGYLASFAVCARRAPLIGCAVATGGVAGYEYDKPLVDGERFATGGLGGVFYMGLRTGFEIPLNPRFALRLDVDAQLPIYRADVIQHDASGQTSLLPMLSGFVSVVPSF